jgi:CheY-like chemotaxis protein
LYAEDEDDDAFFMQRAFQQAGLSHPLVIVRDGQEAIDYLSGAGRYADRPAFPLPCLLLLDLNLPKKSGLDVLQWLRRESPVSLLPVIIFTSSLQEADLRRAYAQGANAYLAKPSAPEELIATVKIIHDFWLTRNRAPETR